MHTRTPSTSGCTGLEQHVYEDRSKGILFAADVTTTGIGTGVSRAECGSTVRRQDTYLAYL